MNATNNVHEAIANLNDLELALLTCLVADQHCIIRAPEELLSDVQSELELIASSSFGLSSTVFACSPTASLGDFSDTVVVDDITGAGASGLEDSPSDLPGPTNVLDSRRVANVVIARDLDEACRNVQIQALELMRSRCIYSRTGVHTTPQHFLFIALIGFSVPGPPFLTPHLNDFFFISHYHSPSLDHPLLDSHQPRSTTPPSASVTQPYIARPRSTNNSNHPYEKPPPIITESDLSRLIALTKRTLTTAEVRRYIHNIPTFLRLHRAVAGGVSAISSRHLTQLSCVLAAFHSPPAMHGQPLLKAMDASRSPFVSPSIVALAARKVYPHRIEVATPAEERSMQWGSEWEAVKWMLQGMTPELILEEVLQAVEVPL